MAVAPASVVVLVAVFGQSPEVVSPVAPRPVPKLLAPLPAPRTARGRGHRVAAGGRRQRRPGVRGQRYPRARRARRVGQVRRQAASRALSPSPWLPMRVQLGVPSLQVVAADVPQGETGPAAARAGRSPPAARDHAAHPARLTLQRPIRARDCRTCGFDGRLTVVNAIRPFRCDRRAGADERQGSPAAWRRRGSWPRRARRASRWRRRRTPTTSGARRPSCRRGCRPSHVTRSCRRPRSAPSWPRCATR